MASGLIGANNPTASLGEAGEEDALVPEMPLKIEELKKYGLFTVLGKYFNIIIDGLFCFSIVLYISQNTNNHKQAHIAQFNSIINLSDFDLHVIFFRRNNLMVKQLFLGMQCSSCGERFPKSHKKQYSDHLDWHFRENKKEKEGGKKVISRSWYFELVVSIFLLCHSLNLLILKDLINKIFPIV